MNKTNIPYVINADGSQGYAWNLFYGCLEISEGCKNCWSRKIAKRFSDNPCYKGLVDKAGQWTGKLNYIYEKTPKFKNGQTVFINPQSDIFNANGEYLEKVFNAIKIFDKTAFLILTKRIKHLLPTAKINFPNLWLGITVCTQKEADENIPLLIEIKKNNPAIKTWLSIEPILENIDLYISPLIIPTWIVVGGESGKNARQISPIWIYDIKDFCRWHYIPFYFKQWSQGMFSNWKIAKLGGIEYKEIPKFI